jgi:hypothetical protein
MDLDEMLGRNRVTPEYSDGYRQVRFGNPDSDDKGVVIRNEGGALRVVAWYDGDYVICNAAVTLRQLVDLLGLSEMDL